MAKVAITEQYLSDIADAIREKTGDSEATYLPSEMAEAIADIEGGIIPSGTYSITSNGIYDIVSFASVDVNVSGGGGDTSVEDAFVTRTLSEYSNSRVTSIESYAFYMNKSLKDITFPNVISVGSYAFYSCGVRMASFAKATYIGGSAFRYCSQLMSLYMLASTVASLVNSIALQSTPMSVSTYTGAFGSIYVPASLVDSYKTATNWSAYSARITSYVE